MALKSEVIRFQYEKDLKEKLNRFLETHPKIKIIGQSQSGNFTYFSFLVIIYEEQD
jgi:hypothetical protein